MSEAQTEIRTLLAPISGGTVMLPGSVVAEVVDYSAPKPYEDAPDWLLGGMNWSDWNLPVVSFAMLSGASESEDTGERSRILVLKSLSESTVTPYLGMLIAGVPRLARVKAGGLKKPTKVEGFPCVFREVSLGEERVLIPDLDQLTKTVEEIVGRE